MDLFAWALLSATVLYAISALAFLIGLHLPDSNTCSPTRPFVSVIIAARNEANYIGECLKRLTDQTYPTALYEILVVDDNSNDATADIVKQYAHEHPGVTSLVVGGGFPEMSALT